MKLINVRNESSGVYQIFTRFTWYKTFFNLSFQSLNQLVTQYSSLMYFFIIDIRKIKAYLD